VSNYFLSDIVDKTAQYVAKNGADFLTRIQANEASNPKFSFLKEGDPYHAYFLMKVNEGPEGASSKRGFC
jgi:splicing factor 3A subunit 1